MKARLYIAIAAGLALGFLFGAAANAAPVLRGSVTVDAERVTLGDLFDGAGAKADVVVAPAPKFGRQAVYDAEWLANVAHANGLDWRPASRTDHVTVERRAETVPAGEIEAALKEAVAERASGSGKKVEVVVDNRNIPLFSDPNAQSDLQIRSLWVDRDTTRFSATIAASADASAQIVKVSGRIYEKTSVPVLTRRVATTDVIGAGDIRFIEVRSDALADDVITDPDALIGMSPRRPATDGVPLRSGDFRAPIVIAKGTLVTMVVETPYMTLTAQGRATEDGAKGDVIKVMNTQSKTTVDATVDGPSRVVVHTAASQAAAVTDGQKAVR